MEVPEIAPEEVAPLGEARAAVTAVKGGAENAFEHDASAMASSLPFALSAESATTAPVSQPYSEFIYH